MFLVLAGVCDGLDRSLALMFLTKSLTFICFRKLICHLPFAICFATPDFKSTLINDNSKHVPTIQRTLQAIQIPPTRRKICETIDKFRTTPKTRPYYIVLIRKAAE